MQGYASPLSSPLTIAGGDKQQSSMPGAGDNVRTASGAEKTRSSPINNGKRTGTSPHDDSYSATFESESNIENDVVPAEDGVENGILFEAL